MVWLLLALGCARPPVAEAPAPEGGPTLPAEARSWYLRARAAEARGDLQAADRAMDWVLRLDRADPWAWVRVAEHHLGRGDWAAARAHAEGALERDATLPEAHRVAGLAAAAEGDADALVHLEQAGELPGVIGTRLRVLWAMGRRDDAAALLAGMGRGGTADEGLDRAQAALEIGEPTAALALALEVLPNPGWGPDALGVAVAAGAGTCGLLDVHRWAAERHGLVEDPRWRDALRELAEASGDDALLEAVLRRGEPVPYVAWLRDRGRADDALAWLDARPGSSATAELWRSALQADARLRDGDAVGALALTEGGEHHRTVAWVRAGALVATGQVDAAVDLARHSGSDEVDGELRAGRVLLAAGRRDEALRAWAEAGHAPLLAARAEVVGGVEAWSVVLAADPSLVDARIALATLEPQRVDELLPPDSCDPAVLVARARLADGCEARDRWLRAMQARPGDAEVRRGVDEGTRACPGG